MPISYYSLFLLLEEKGIPVSDLRYKHNFNPKTVDALLENKSITTDTIERLCRLLDCQPGDILKYVPDKDWMG